MSSTLMHIIWTVVLLVLFIGIVIWAWSKRRLRSFQEAARIPLEDNDHTPPARERRDG
jgi:cytochrome c oxidase cbb3-type subunit IV